MTMVTAKPQQESEKHHDRQKPCRGCRRCRVDYHLSDEEEEEESLSSFSSGCQRAGDANDDDDDDDAAAMTMTTNNNDHPSNDNSSIVALAVPWTLLVVALIAAAVVMNTATTTTTPSTITDDAAAAAAALSSNDGAFLLLFDRQQQQHDEQNRYLLDSSSSSSSTTTSNVYGSGNSPGGGGPTRTYKYVFDEENHNDEHHHSQPPHHSHHQIYNEEHDPLFPLTTSDYWGFGLAIIGLLIAAGGGIGGGGILVPIYILVMGFSPKHAIPLSNITILGGSFANTYLNAKKRHPAADRPLMDWDIILVMEPMAIAGALIGAFLNKILPEILLTVLLVLLLAFTANNSLRKAFRMYKKETQQMMQEQNQLRVRADGTKESELTRMAREQEEERGDNDNDDDDNRNKDAEDDEQEQDEEAVLFEKPELPPMEHPAATESEDERAKGKNGNDTDDDDDDTFEPLTHQIELDLKKKALRERILEEERTIPSANIKALVVLFVVVLIVNVLKGGGAFPSPLGITCGSKSFWAANAFLMLWILVVMLAARKYLVERYHQKRSCDYPYAQGDIKWDERATVVFPCICCLAGFFAGMFGVGGGIVKGPLMLAMGVHPAVSSASSACMILFTSFTATTSYVVFGLMVTDYAVVGFIVGFIATYVGQVGLSYLMKRAGAQRNSYIAFSIGSVVLISAVLMTIQSLLSMAQGEKHHAGGICGKGD